MPENRHDGALPTEISVAKRLYNAKIAQLVEHNLAKVRVAGSSPVFRSTLMSHRSHSCPDGGMVDTKDLKSFGLTAVRVQVPLRVQSIPDN